MSATYKVLRYRAHNVLCVSDIDWNLEGNHLFLVGGKNNQGKSSALIALQMALCGRSGMEYPEIALKNGETEGWVKIDLGATGDEEISDLQVELKLKRRRGGQIVEEFRVLGPEGEEVPEPRTLLKRLYQLRGFDPLAFERLDKKGKLELFRKLLGLDFTEQKKDHQRLYKDREGVNRDLKNAYARLETMPCHQDATAVEVSATELMAELRRRQDVNRHNEQARANLQRHQIETQKEEQSIIAQHAAVADLVLQLQRAKDHLNALQSHSDTVSLPALHAEENRIDQMVDADTAEIERQIEDSESVNRKVRDNKHRLDVLADVENLEVESGKLTNEMDKIMEAQQQAIQDAQWPVEGLSMDEDGVLYQGLPFEQAAKSVRVRTSMLMGMAMNPRLRLLVSQDGGDMDEDTLAELGKLLEEHDYQLLLELVTRGKEDEARCQVIIQDGKQVESIPDVAGR